MEVLQGNSFWKDCSTKHFWATERSNFAALIYWQGMRMLSGRNFRIGKIFRELQPLAAPQDNEFSLAKLGFSSLSVKSSLSATAAENFEAAYKSKFELTRVTCTLLLHRRPGSYRIPVFCTQLKYFWKNYLNIAIFNGWFFCANKPLNKQSVGRGAN